MKRIVLPLMLSITLLAGACSESSFQEATGKGTIRAINAIEASQEVGFFIQEQLISNVPYKGVSSFAQYDDITFDFNFDVLFSGDQQNTRIITQTVDIAADQDYTFLLSGTVAAPVLTLWEAPVRVFDANATIFQARFAHTANSLGSIDYYFAADGVVPVLGAQVATLSFGEIADAIEFEAGIFVLTITAAGDPSDVLFTSSASTFTVQSDIIVTPFTGNTNDNAPIVVRSLSTLGTVATLTDASYPATVEFLHASMDLGAADIYDDDTLLSQVLANHNFQDRSPEIPVATGASTFRYTPAGDTSVISVEGLLTVVNGLRYRFVVLGNSGSFVTTTLLPDRHPVDTAVKILLYHASRNFELMDFYIVAAGVPIDNELPFRGGLGIGIASPVAGIAAGSYDVYVTDFGTKSILAGPLRIDVALRDVVDLFVFDTVDPAVVELQILPTP